MEKTIRILTTYGSESETDILHKIIHQFEKGINDNCFLAAMK